MLPLRVLIADDHRLFRQGLIGLLQTRPDLVEVVGEASTGREGLRLAERLKPDVILLDILMPDEDGLATAAQLRATQPQVAIVILTSSDQDEHLLRAVRLGVAGYLLKSLDASELFELLGDLRRGDAAMTRTMAAQLLQSLRRGSAQADSSAAQLTERELDVLRLVAQGATNSGIADRLCISINTVKVHLRNIQVKLKLENRTQIAAFAIQTGLAHPKPVASDENIGEYE